jgi:hypothetical protein
MRQIGGFKGLESPWKVKAGYPLSQRSPIWVPHTSNLMCGHHLRKQTTAFLKPTQTPGFPSFAKANDRLPYPTPKSECPIFATVLSSLRWASRKARPFSTNLSRPIRTRSLRTGGNVDCSGPCFRHNPAAQKSWSKRPNLSPFPLASYPLTTLKNPTKTLSSL